MECMECENKTKKLFTDHRSPPLSDDACLCKSCSKSSIDERIDELEGDVRSLVRTRDNMK